jgi:hypothetical protein
MAHYSKLLKTPNQNIVEESQLLAKENGCPNFPYQADEGWEQSSGIAGIAKLSISNKATNF